MIKKNIGKYIINNWESHLDTVKNISSSSLRVPLVDSLVKLYNFDEVCENLYENNSRKPSSADGILVLDDGIILIEFKTGFKRKITRENLNEEKSKCQKTNEYCKEYWNLFFKEQRLEKSVLISSIKLKAVESYTTLEKKVMPLCENLQKPKCFIKFFVVIDENGEDNMENMLSELSMSESSETNCFQEIKESLKRYHKISDTKGEDYFYDEIRVLSSVDFKALIEQQQVT